ncbi:exonuclease domain-containing protein [Leptospira levettii]|uniref:Exonuclease domain-containing protein n=1 Tax=Leptospira levettii TaxID=2023178 RepID=A0AAW5VA08_9LEPT|nr:exonuclease domain-containing protein [Leptospira levettii]MCW7512098.1 exonuclease domain-containing protein [Leptospira levettii]MCW7517163.1 exonuclease domain-containing protein [Leptospira levettii]
MEDKKKTFTALDFETAQGYRWSICQVGIVVYEDFQIKEELEILVKPPSNHYWNIFSDIHGLTADHTKDSPTFDIVWNSIESYIVNQTVVAHNGLSFDFPALRKTLEFYQIEEPIYEKADTYRIYGEKLSTLCEKYNIALDHHNALSDARACGELYKRFLIGQG